MAKNLKRYCQAWELRQQGKKLKEIAKIMGLKSGEWPRCMILHINGKIKYHRPKSKELLNLIKKYNKGV
jgi:hypothetical protein